MLRDIIKALRSFGKMFNIIPNTDYSVISSKDSDKQRLANDWSKIGGDLYKAMESYERRQQPHSTRK